MNPPQKHHFLPEFYLKQWAQPDGRLVEYSKPFGCTVKPKRTHPGGTGFIRKLYSVGELGHELESVFLSPVDSRAADALAAMSRGINFSSAQRIAWASFVSTLLSRMPEDIALIKQIVKELVEYFVPAFQPVFEKLKSGNETRSFRELTDDLVSKSDQRAIDFAKRIMSSERLIREIAAMEWSILTTTRAKFEFITSDRPVIYTNVLGNENSHIVLPVGPRLLFVAAKDRKLIERLRDVVEDKLVAEVNMKVTTSAHKYVFGSDDRHLRFVENRMGTTKDVTLVERLYKLQKENYGPMLSGLAQVNLDELGDAQQNLKE